MENLEYPFQKVYENRIFQVSTPDFLYKSTIKLWKLWNIKGINSARNLELKGITNKIKQVNNLLKKQVTYFENCYSKKCSRCDAEKEFM